ncbi:hypothetical protein GT045_09195 [Streptomyces sp. SID486]|uniref:hypothetical protein n=1 Tax=unclassified Streptomyces TaxID=2593676 RepID=UPI00136875E6|nr:hypothetical protein [Streptomyces sp. SID486]MYX94980.1 hypothetical protein [Streptomyces sp. SID486]
MNGNQIEGLIGMLATLGILVVLILPSALGALHDRRVDRQLRQAERGPARTAPAARTPAPVRAAARPAAPRNGDARRQHGAARPV